MVSFCWPSTHITDGSSLERDVVLIGTTLLSFNVPINDS